MLALLLLLFILIPIAELFVIIQVGEAIGAWWTLGLLVVDSLLGTLLMRAQGRAAWRRFNLAVAEARPPTREVIDGVLVIFGGALLLAPGFITDIFGLLFLFPPTRVLLRGLIVRRAALRMLRAVPVQGAGPPFGSRPQDVDGHAVDIEPDQLDHGR